jgi:transcription elongation factor Elf1
MGVKIDGFDEDELMEAIVDDILEVTKEHLQTEAQKGVFECPECESTEFDIKAYVDDGEIHGAGVCIECNTRSELNIDTSQIDGLR